MTENNSTSNTTPGPQGWQSVTPEQAPQSVTPEQAPQYFNTQQPIGGEQGHVPTPNYFGTPQQPNPTGLGPVQPPKKQGRGLLIGTAAVVAGLIGLTGIAVAGNNSGTAAAPAPAPAATSASAEPSYTPEPTPTEAETDPSTYVPSKEHFSLSLKRTSKECFGSAGCIVTVKIKAAIDHAAVPDTGTLTVYYKIKGDEDGPVEDYVEFDLDADTYEADSQVLSTPRSGTKVSIAVTDFEYEVY